MAASCHCWPSLAIKTAPGLVPFPMALCCHQQQPKHFPHQLHTSHLHLHTSHLHLHTLHIGSSHLLCHLQPQNNLHLTGSLSPSTAIEALQSTLQLHTSHLVGSSCLQPQSFIIFNSDQTLKWPSSHQLFITINSNQSSFHTLTPHLPLHWLLLPPTTVICHLQWWSNLCPHTQELLPSLHLTYPQYMCFALCPYNPSHTYHTLSFHLQLHVTSIDQLLSWCHVHIFCLVYISQSDQIWPSSIFILYFHHGWYNRQEMQVQGPNQSYKAT